MTGANEVPDRGAVSEMITGDRSEIRLVARALVRDRAALLGGLLFMVVVIACLLAAVIAPSDPYVIRPEMRLAPPGTGAYLLGGDELGRDMLSRLLWGGQSSLIIGFGPVLAACLIGGVVGLIAGYAGGAWDQGIMRVMDVFLAFPAILLALGIAAAMGPGRINVVIALTVVLVPSFARIIRASTLSLRQLDFVTAATTIGADNRRIILRHILPNILSPVVVMVTLQVGRAIIAGAGLSFLGLGVIPPVPDWGSMLSAGQHLLVVAPHIATLPGLMIFLLTLCLNLLGDGFRDAIDPYMRHR